MTTDQKRRLNIYQCQECLHLTCTVDVDDGTTPFSIGCQSAKLCNGMMYSSFYVVHPGRQPTHEWYKPTSLDGLHPATRDHVEKGGLLLRRIPSPQIADAARKAARS